MEDLEQGKGVPSLVREFNELIAKITQVEWKKALTQGQRTYNIKLYNIDKLSPKKVRDLYAHLADR